MSIILKVCSFLFSALLLFSCVEATAQRRPKKSDDAGIGRDEALKIKKAQRAAKIAEYEAKKQHVRDLQSKSTLKRMKKNLKHAKKLSKGKDIPLHKRIFRRKKVV